MPAPDTFSTERFALRPLQRADAAALMGTLGDAGQCRFLSRAEFTSEEELWGWLADPEWDGRTWIAVDGEDRVVGRFVAVPGHEDGVVEIGYITCAETQGRGVARECTAVLVEHLLAEGNRKILAEIDFENTPSIRLVERLGFTREALFREHETTHAGLRDVAIYALLASGRG
ncbi:GNAT family N-acetyltransferase [Qipengyuania flava]|uniref:GNAT family N-acetyltransferase n=1 Tax=Qipengyuania flava TaxID=192812 RepID=UPI001C62D108|nr:GNAT family protein [Qipengyuania flava]QYJ06469.1 GNAT family N-acetyltransferase [Qipengyuania flava]